MTETPSPPKATRIRSLGIESPWQAALLLPDRWDDLRWPVTRFAGLKGLGEGERIVIGGHLASAPSLRFDGAPRMTFSLQDPDGERIGVTFFGDTRGLALPGDEPIYIQGQLRHHDHRLWLTSPELLEPLWLDQLRPVYPGKPRVITPQRVREYVLHQLPRVIDEAAQRLYQDLPATPLARQAAEALGISQAADIAELLRRAHLPQSLAHGEAAQRTLQRLAASIRITQTRHSAPVPRQRSLLISAEQRRQVLSRVPFELSGDQHQAINAMWEALQRRTPMRHLISGDVGSGKTVVFGCVAAGCLSSGGRVAILAPTAPLAKQIQANFQSWWPQMPTELVIGDTADTDSDRTSARCLIGTTAMLHTRTGELDLVVVDEQQKFSTQQREQLLQAGNAHLVEATATCIPRSMALLKYGGWEVSRLRTTHVAKRLQTRIIRRYEDASQARAMMDRIAATIMAGGQALVVYPLREGHEKSRFGVSDALALFQKHFPGRVRGVDGAMASKDKIEAVNALKTGDADMLVATSVVEVGIDIPNVRRAVVVHPERMGLTTLHQIRGRVARAGGEGDFDLYLPEPVSDTSEARLQALIEVSDGFEIAERDMALRGIGDMSADSTQQSGQDAGVLIGRPIQLEDLDWVSQFEDNVHGDQSGE